MHRQEHCNLLAAISYDVRVAWEPGQRRARLELEEPYEEVPHHLLIPLCDWARDALHIYWEGFTEQSHLDEARLRQFGLEMRVSLGQQNGDLTLIALEGQWRRDTDFLLDSIEYLLHRYGQERDRATELQLILDAGYSAYVVNTDGDGLERRVSSGIRQAAESAASSADDAGDHLSNAWNAAYGRTPDPVKGYSEAVKAAEAALAAHVSPDNPRQKLGTMIRDVNTKPQKWQLLDGPGPGVDTVLVIMRQLWLGQTSRHGGVSATKPETIEQAQAAVMLAAALVQLASSGAFRKL